MPRVAFSSSSSDIADVLCDAFNATRWRERLELQLGEMFRTGFFNSVRRKQLPGPSLDMLKLKELFKLKHESGTFLDISCILL